MGPAAETALHFAAPWPEGLKLLLAYGGGVAKSQLESTDSDGETPLVKAMKLQKVASVRLLVESGATVSHHDIGGIGKTLFMTLDSPNDIASSREIARILIDTLADRREELLCLALRELPQQDIEYIQLNRKETLDYEASWIVRLLQTYGIPFPSYLEEVKYGGSLLDRFLPPDRNKRIGVFRSRCWDPSASVFHLINMVDSMCQQFWDRGFRKIFTWGPLARVLNSIPSPESPQHILLNNVLDTMVWYEKHGIGLRSPMESSGLLRKCPDDQRPYFAIIHWVAYSLGSALHSCMNHTLGQAREVYTCQLISDSVKDTCKCFCTGLKRGCTPASLFARGLFEDRILDLERLMPWGDLVTKHTTRDSAQRTALDLVRVITFKELGMKHTCCKPDRDASARYCTGVRRCMDADEIEEIRKEDEYQSQHLDKLMSEFSALWNPDVSFSEFVKAIWEPRMTAWGQEKDNITDEERRRWLDIGVDLHVS